MAERIMPRKSTLEWNDLIGVLICIVIICCMVGVIALATIHHRDELYFRCGSVIDAGYWITLEPGSQLYQVYAYNELTGAEEYRSSNTQRIHFGDKMDADEYRKHCQRNTP